MEAFSDGEHIVNITPKRGPGCDHMDCADLLPVALPTAPGHHTSGSDGSETQLEEMEDRIDVLERQLVCGSESGLDYLLEVNNVAYPIQTLKPTAFVSLNL